VLLPAMKDSYARFKEVQPSAILLNRSFFALVLVADDHF